MHVVPRYKKQPFATFYSEYDPNNIEKAGKLKDTQKKAIEGHEWNK